MNISSVHVILNENNVFGNNIPSKCDSLHVLFTKPSYF